MHLAAVISWLTVAASAAAKLGMAHQVRLNWQRKTTAGMSAPFFAAALASYALWVASGIEGGSLLLIAGQGPGVVLCLAVGAQWAWYDRLRRGRAGQDFSDEMNSAQVSALKARTGEVPPSWLSRTPTTEPS